MTQAAELTQNKSNGQTTESEAAATVREAFDRAKAGFVKDQVPTHSSPHHVLEMHEMVMVSVSCFQEIYDRQRTEFMPVSRFYHPSLRVKSQLLAYEGRIRYEIVSRLCRTSIMQPIIFEIWFESS